MYLLLVESNKPREVTKRYDCEVISKELYLKHKEENFKFLQDQAKDSGKEIMIIEYDGRPLVSIRPKVEINLGDGIFNII